MTRAARTPLPPELEPPEIDPRSVHAFRHGYPDPLVRWHLHHDYELHLIVDGSGRMFVGDHIGDFRPGQLVMTGPRLPHNWISDTRPGAALAVRDCVVQFRERLVPALAEHAPELAVLLPLLDRARGGIEFHGDVRGEAGRRFDDIIDSEPSGRIGLLIAFLERLARERHYTLLSTVPPPARTDVASFDKLERAIRHISEHHADDLRASTVADLLEMDASAFSRLFTRLTGHGFAQFVNRVRVARACGLLSESDRSVTEIAQAVGYNNMANFNRRFRELKGSTPSRYRKRSREGHETGGTDPS